MPSTNFTLIYPQRLRNTQDRNIITNSNFFCATCNRVFLIINTDIVIKARLFTQSNERP